MKKADFYIFKRITQSQRKFPLTAFVMWLFFLVYSPVFSQSNYEVRKIKFSGNKTFGDSELLDHMVLHNSNIIKRLIQRKDAALFHHEFLETDLERLTRFYQSEGFLNAEVLIDSLRIDDKKNTVSIDILIRENTYVKVDSISISIADTLGNKSFLRRIKRQSVLNTDDRFTDELLYENIAAINNIFMNQGYVYAKTDFDLDLKEKENSIDIHYEVNPGAVCQFDSTTISGNRYVKEKYIRRILKYDTGERFSKKELDKTRKDIYELQLFKVVSLIPDVDKNSEKNPISIKVEIEEMPRLMSKFGAGWGTEDKFRAFADITYRGVFKATSRLNLYAKHSALNPYYISLSWIEPQFFANKLSATINPYLIREKETSYDVQRLGINLPVAYSFDDKFSTSLSYYFERVKVLESNESKSTTNPESKNFLYNKSGLSGTFTYNNAQPVLSPTRGELISIGAKLNGYIFGGDYNYTRFWVDARKYMRIKKNYLSIRGMIGSIKSSDNPSYIPVEDRFYSGGTNSNRGWKRYTLGQINSATGTVDGGNSIIEMNIEVRRLIFWKVELAAFLDFGNVWSNSYYFRLNDLEYGLGGGIRINTPIGPIRLDVGVPVSESVKTPHFFISVGQAF